MPMMRSVRCGSVDAVHLELVQYVETSQVCINEYFRRPATRRRTQHVALFISPIVACEQNWHTAKAFTLARIPRDSHNAFYLPLRTPSEELSHPILDGFNATTALPRPQFTQRKFGKCRSNAKHITVRFIWRKLCVYVSIYLLHVSSLCHIEGRVVISKTALALHRVLWRKHKNESK
ncbi:hypothetical protein SFRURICE_000096 [Spodoptera frugiperda]|nr:hypothetical protein SFRURICE_000096 [Spodoptera frugiperda]